MITVDELISMMGIYDSETCPYLEGKKESMRAIRCPHLSNALHAGLMERGFRHSGDIFYIPECENCRECLPIRVAVRDFRPSKKQRHILNKNRDVAVSVCEPEPTPLKFDLYKRYLLLQHPGKEADNASYENYVDFLYPRLTSLAEIQYTIDGRLAGITMADIIPNVGFSSIYHYFEPQFASRSIGVFSVLAEIILCAHFRAPYYYLGFWIPDCKKMSYKSQYRPNEVLRDGVWVPNPFEERGGHDFTKTSAQPEDDNL